MINTNKQTVVIIVPVIALFIAGCTANDPMFSEQPAGFWAGLWHGLISLFTFIIGLFTS